MFTSLSPTKDTHSVVASLNQVGAGSVPAHGARAGNEEGLASLLGVEDLAEHANAVAEHGDERGRHVRGTGGGIGKENLDISVN